jgi:hypothetical protein
MRFYAAPLETRRTVRSFTRAENVECALLPIPPDRILAFVLRTLVSDEANPRVPKSAVGFAQSHYSAFTYAAAFCAKRHRKSSPVRIARLCCFVAHGIFQKLMVRTRYPPFSTNRIGTADMPKCSRRTFRISGIRFSTFGHIRSMPVLLREFATVDLVMED